MHSYLCFCVKIYIYDNALCNINISAILCVLINIDTFCYHISFIQVEKQTAVAKTV
jgi:hypothetical protein